MYFFLSVFPLSFFGFDENDLHDCEPDASKEIRKKKRKKSGKRSTTRVCLSWLYSRQRCLAVEPALAKRTSKSCRHHAEAEGKAVHAVTEKREQSNEGRFWWAQPAPPRRMSVAARSRRDATLVDGQCYGHYPDNTWRAVPIYKFRQCGGNIHS